MRRIDSIEDHMRGVVTYELIDGQRITFDRRAVQERGAAELLRQYGYSHLLPIERSPVYQCGRFVGTLPPDFDPYNIRSRSPLYDPRPGDFLRDGANWVAHRSLGLGDLTSIPGFLPGEQP